MADRIKSMEVICNVAALGSVSAAARALRISPTMVGKHIDATEYDVGKRLFVRSTKGMELTEAGKKYVSLSKALLIQYSGIYDSLKDSPEDLSGEITLRTCYDLLEGLVDAAVMKFSSFYPGVRFTILTDPEKLQAIGANELAVIYGISDNDQNRTEILRHTEGVVVCAPSYVATYHAPVTLDDLKRHQCLVLKSSLLPESSWWKFGRHGEYPVHVSGRIAADDLRVLLRAALAGAGLLWCARDVVSAYIESGELLELRIDKPPVQNLPISAQFRANGASPIVLRLVEFLKNELWNPANGDWGNASGEKSLAPLRPISGLAGSGPGSKAQSN
jgi:DNA-binding transcriptional LysR family regulator